MDRSRTSTTAVRTWALLLLTAGLLVAAPSGAQAPVPAPDETPVSAESEGPQAIPASKIAGQAQETLAELNRLRQLAGQQASITAIEERLPVVRKNIERLGPGEEIDPTSLGNQSILQDQRAQWARVGEELEKGRNSTGDRAARLGKAIDSLAELRGVWEKTSEQAVTEGLPPAVMTRIGDTLASILDVEKLLKTRRADVLTLQNEVAASEEITLAEMARLAAAEKRFQEELFQSKHAPLWKLVTPEQMQAERSGELRSVWNESPEVSRDYFGSHERSFVLFVVGFLLMIGSLTILGRRAGPLAEENATFEPTYRLMRRPVAATLMRSMLVCPFVFEAMPRVMAAAYWALLPIAFLRVLPVLIGKDMGPAIYLLTGWYALAWTRIFLIASPGLSRWLLAIEGSMVVVFLALLLHPTRLRKLERSDFSMTAIRLLLVVSIALLVCAVAANAVGNVTLAHLLDEGTLVAHCIALLAFGSLQILSGMLAVVLRTPLARKLSMVRHHGPLLRRRGTRLLGFVTFGFWAWLTLDAFRIREAVFEGVAGVLNARVTLGDLDLSMGDVLLFLFMVWASFAISRFVRFVLDEDVLPRADLPRGVPFAISVLVRYAILLTGFMVAVAAAGLDMSRFALMVGALGVGIGIGLQDVVNNFVSGLILLFERPIQRGDTVEVGEVRGEIAAIGLRASTLRTFEGAEFVIPNSQFVSQAFSNWTLSDRQRRIHINVGVEYGTDPERVLELLLEIARAEPKVLNEPEPQALMLAFGESSLDFELRAWTAEVESWVSIRSRLTVEINRALTEAGITIPFPQRDLHVKSVVDPD